VPECFSTTREGGINAKLDLTHAIDGFAGNEHSMPIVPLYNDVVQLLAKSGISYTPTLIVAYGGPFAENFYYENTEVHDDPKVRRFIPHNLVDVMILITTTSMNRPTMRNMTTRHMALLLLQSLSVRAMSEESR